MYFKIFSSFLIITAFDILKQILGVSFDKEETQCETVLGNDLTIENVAKLIKAGSFKNIIVMSGAGISVAAGIPDFRLIIFVLFDFY